MQSYLKDPKNNFCPRFFLKRQRVVKTSWFFQTFLLRMPIFLTNLVYPLAQHFCDSWFLINVLFEIKSDLTQNYPTGEPYNTETKLNRQKLQKPTNFS